MITFAADNQCDGKMATTTFAPFARPLYVMLKPIGPLCNLSCKYCYYLEKSHLYRDSKMKGQVMDSGLLEQFIEQYIGSQTQGDVLFTWHGGEPLLLPLSFYQRALELQKRYARGHRIDNCIQTNGTLLNDEWCRFFKENNWLVGVSIDGPQEFHDKYRRNRHGGPTFSNVMAGIELLDKHQVEWNAMAVVNRYNAENPVSFYSFFKSIGCRYIQFTPVVERIYIHADGRYLAFGGDGKKAEIADYSVTPEQWGYFLCTLFDEWVKADVGSYFIQLFDATLANWVGVQPGLCSVARTCGHAGVMEHNGDVYSCDHYVFPEFRLGNIHTDTLLEMMYGERQLMFGADKEKKLPKQCRECEYLFTCHGECPKNRFLKTADGEPGLNYLCKGYRRFFEHVAPAMDFMKNELMHERPPMNVMNSLSGL